MLQFRNRSSTLIRTNSIRVRATTKTEMTRMTTSKCWGAQKGLIMLGINVPFDLSFSPSRRLLENSVLVCSLLVTNEHWACITPSAYQFHSRDYLHHSYLRNPRCYWQVVDIFLASTRYSRYESKLRLFVWHKNKRTLFYFSCSYSVVATVVTK